MKFHDDSYCDEYYVVVKLWRIFNVFSVAPVTLVLSIALYVAFVAITFAFASLDAAVASVATATLFFCAYRFLNLILKPKEIWLQNGVAEFTERRLVRRLYGKGYELPPRRIDYRVENVRDIEFHQNAIERFFNVGRVSFSGDINVRMNEDCMSSKIRIPERIVICGIRNFSRTRDTVDALLRPDFEYVIEPE